MPGHTNSALALWGLNRNHRAGKKALRYDRSNLGVDGETPLYTGTEVDSVH